VVGTKDQFFSVESVRQTRDAFAAEDFPIETREIPNHDHNYYRRSGEINDMVWKFLSPNTWTPTRATAPTTSRRTAMR